LTVWPARAREVPQVVGQVRFVTGLDLGRGELAVADEAERLAVAKGPGAVDVGHEGAQRRCLGVVRVDADALVVTADEAAWFDLVPGVVAARAVEGVLALARDGAARPQVADPLGARVGPGLDPHEARLGVELEERDF
jgi:hypothetical protein